MKLREPLSGKPPTEVGAGDHTAPGVVASTEASAIQDSAHARGPTSPSWSWAPKKVTQQRSARDTIPFLTERTDLFFDFQSSRHAQHSHPSLRTLAVTGRHRNRFLDDCHLRLSVGHQVGDVASHPAFRSK